MCHYLLASAIHKTSTGQTLKSLDRISLHLHWTLVTWMICSVLFYVLMHSLIWHTLYVLFRMYSLILHTCNSHHSTLNDTTIVWVVIRFNKIHCILLTLHASAELLSNIVTHYVLVLCWDTVGRWRQALLVFRQLNVMNQMIGNCLVFSSHRKFVNKSIDK